MTTPRPTARRHAVARLLALLGLLALLLGQAPGLGRPSGALAAGPSGAAIPTADLANFKLVQAEDFARSLTIGQWPGPYAATWGTYGEWPDTMGQNGTNSGYSHTRVVSVQDGMLDYYLHTEDGRSLAAAVLPVEADHLYGRVSIRMRADPVPGYKTAFLYWPESGVWPRDGEIDFPEGNLTGGVEGFMHRQGASQGSDQAWFGTSARYPDWHTYTLEWQPNSLELFVDGASVGRSTERVPNTKMHFVLQAERCLDGCAAPANAAGHLQIDWVAVWDYAPGTPGGATSPPPATPSPTPAPTAPAAADGLTLVQPATPDRTAVAPGGTIGATATYRNGGGQPLVVNYAALALRGPNGERTDFTPARGTATVAAGATLTLQGTATLPPGAATGTWGAVSTWQGADGQWHESAHTALTVVAPSQPALASPAPASPAPTPTPHHAPSAFSDVPANHPAAEAIGQLAARGIVRGYDPSTFGPTDPVLRAQLAAMLVRAMGWGGQPPANPFTDRDGVDDELWRAIATLADHGVARGYGGGLYGTTDPVLNAQVVSFVTKAMVSAGYWQLQPDDGRTYPNVAAGSGHRQDLVTYVHYAGAVHGAEDTTGAFAGWDEQSSRAWFAFVLWRALESHFGVGLVP